MARRKRKRSTVKDATESLQSIGHEEQWGGGEKAVQRTKKYKDGNGNTGLSSRPTPTLLGIPAELRNEIYYHVLVDDDFPIGVNRDHQQPDLLLVSRQIREEATPVFHQNNLVHLTIYNLKLEPQANHWCWRDKLGGFEFDFAGINRWDNFVDWLRKYRAHDRAAVDLVSKMRVEQDKHKWYGRRGLIWAFDLLDALGHARWATVERALEVYRKIVEARCSSDEYKVGFVD